MSRFTTPYHGCDGCGVQCWASTGRSRGIECGVPDDAAPKKNPQRAANRHPRVATQEFARRFKVAANRKGRRSMQRKSAAALCLLAVAILLACSRNGPPNSLLESAGYYIRNGTAHYLNAYPGKAFEIDDADAATFKALDSTDGRDASNVGVNGAPLADADARSFEVLDRRGFAKDPVTSKHDRPISDDPTPFELLDDGLAKDSHVVY